VGVAPTSTGPWRQSEGLSINLVISRCLIRLIELNSSAGSNADGDTRWSRIWLQWPKHPRLEVDLSRRPLA
jgi:hypothetical protein